MIDDTLCPAINLYMFCFFSDIIFFFCSWVVFLFMCNVFMMHLHCISVFFLHCICFTIVLCLCILGEVTTIRDGIALHLLLSASLIHFGTKGRKWRLNIWQRNFWHLLNLTQPALTSNQNFVVSLFILFYLFYRSYFCED